MDVIGLSVGVRKGAVNRLGPYTAMKLGVLETEGYMDPSMVGPLDRKGGCDGAPVGLHKAL